ncbi:F0F1 ATP synthase subunit delta [Pseudonocardia sp.]|uniref:F0F1 ATP synthase subunit delta n=1 Tax=Pseudonocardia sp. TaxID=60912 RepID=UPI0026305C1B|nr:F0F1 ATP synthase subunit delta [Pseudonocardia sp.]
MALTMHASSRDSLAEAGTRLDAHVDGASGGDLARLGDDLFAVLRLVTGDVSLRRHLADPAVPAASRSGLADRLLEGKIGRPALDVVSDLVSARWSASPDLVEAIETLARRATLGVAEKDGTLDEVEDQLFRFGRILDREAELGSLLVDPNTPADKRVALLRDVLGGKVAPVTATLLEQTVRTPRGRSLDLAAEELSELAAARRDRYVAHVRTPVRLTGQQEQRLTDSMTRLFGRPISLQVEFDPDLLGGLVVRVGGDLIDGSVSGKLAAARRKLPG